MDIFENLVAEINPITVFSEKTGDIRLLVLVLHLYAEHFINEIVTKTVEKPGLILEDSDMRFYSKKLTILESLNVFKDPVLLKNLRLLNKIRNDCVHVLDKQQVIVATESRVRELVHIGGPETVLNPISWLGLVAVDTILQLQDLSSTCRKLS